MSHPVLRAPWHAVVGVPLLLCLAALAQYGLLLRFPPAGVASLICMALALLGAVLGAVGIVMTHRLAKKGMQSRDILVHAFAQWHARLPRLLTWQLLAVGSAFAAGSCSMLIWGFVSHDIRFGVIMTMFSVFTAFMIWVAVSSARAEALPFAPQPMHLLARCLTREDAPALWAMTDDVAATLGAARLDHIAIGLLDGFFVTSGTVRATHAGELHGHTLYLCAAHLPWLDTAELRGIIAHEVAHFSGQDLAYSERFAPIYHGFERRVMSLAEYEHDNWIGKVFLRPGRMVALYALYRFRAVERHWSRVREHEADKAGATLVGAQAFAVGLTRAILLETRLHALLAAIDPSGQAGEDIVQQLRLSIQGSPLTDLGNERMAHPFDAHPALAERLEALGMSLDATVRQASAGRSPLATATGCCQGILPWQALTRALTDELHEALRDASRKKPSSVSPFLSPVTSESAS